MGRWVKGPKEKKGQQQSQQSQRKTKVASFAGNLNGAGIVFTKTKSTTKHFSFWPKKSGQDTKESGWMFNSDRMGDYKMRTHIARLLAPINSRLETWIPLFWWRRGFGPTMGGHIGIGRGHCLATRRVHAR